MSAKKRGQILTGRRELAWCAGSLIYQKRLWPCALLRTTVHLIRAGYDNSKPHLCCKMPRGLGPLVHWCELCHHVEVIVKWSVRLIKSGLSRHLDREHECQA